MDQIFERLERLVKAWVNSGASSSAPRGRSTSFKSYGDPDLDAAMAELDDYLDTSKTETERREAEEQRAQTQREQRAREEQRRRYGAQAGGEQTAVVIEQAYRYLGLNPMPLRPGWQPIKTPLHLSPRPQFLLPEAFVAETSTRSTRPSDNETTKNRRRAADGRAKAPTLYLLDVMPSSTALIFLFIPPPETLRAGTFRRLRLPLFPF